MAAGPATATKDVAAYAMGEHLAPSLPLGAWIRLLTGERLHAAPELTPIGGGPMDSSLDEIPMAITRNRSLASGRAFWKCLREIVAINRDEQGDARRTAVRKAIAKKTEKLLQEQGHAIPPIASLLAAWTLELCRHGTRYKAELAHASVDKYVGSTIGPLLIEYASDEDFLELDSIGLTEIYRRVVEGSNFGDKDYVAGRLVEFHDFLTAAFDIDEPDWEEVHLGLAGGMRPVDAGVISRAEYARALALLRDADEETPRTGNRMQCIHVPHVTLAAVERDTHRGPGLDNLRSSIQAP